LPIFPGEVMKILNATEKPELVLSVSLCEDEFTKIGIIQPNPSEQVLSQISTVKEHSPLLKNFHEALAKKEASAIEYFFFERGI